MRRSIPIHEKGRGVGGIGVVRLADNHRPLPDLDTAVDAIVHIIGIGINGRHHIHTLIYIPQGLVQDILPGVDRVFSTGAAKLHSIRLRVNSQVVDSHTAAVLAIAEDILLRVMDTWRQILIGQVGACHCLCIPGQSGLGQGCRQRQC